MFLISRVAVKLSVRRVLIRLIFKLMLMVPPSLLVMICPLLSSGLLIVLLVVVFATLPG